MTVPNSMPPTPAGRAKTIATTHAALSAHGREKAARPVQNNRRQAQVYHPPTVAIGFDRLTVYKTILAASLTGTHRNITGWDGTFQNVGTSVALNSPDDGGLYLFAEGIYAVTVSVTADPAPLATSCVIQGIIDSEFPVSPAATWHGNDAVTGFTTRASASATNYSTGSGFSSGVYTTVAYHDLDAAITSVTVTVDVVRVR